MEFRYREGVVGPGRRERVVESGGSAVGIGRVVVEVETVLVRAQSVLVIGVGRWVFGRRWSGGCKPIKGPGVIGV